MTRTTLRIFRIPRDQWVCGKGQFPWNTYWRVIAPPTGDELAIVSTCNDLDKGLYVEDGRLSRAEFVAVARALKVTVL
jgi:hypothetical protein